jgi:large-conductance mechanosensitive channel
LKYGQFINNVIDFLIVASTIFVVVRSIAALRKSKA